MALPVESIIGLKTRSMNEEEEKTEQHVETPKKALGKGRRKQPEPAKRIGPNSPTIYLLQEEKAYIDKLKAFILLTTSEKMTDHGLVMKAVKEFVNKHYKEFENNYQA